MLEVEWTETHPLVCSGPFDGICIPKAECCASNRCRSGQSRQKCWQPFRSVEVTLYVRDLCSHGCDSSPVLLLPFVDTAGMMDTARATNDKDYLRKMADAKSIKKTSPQVNSGKRSANSAGLSSACTSNKKVKTGKP